MLGRGAGTGRGRWTPEEDRLLVELRTRLGGNKWAAISEALGGGRRSENDVKNRFYNLTKRCDDDDTAARKRKRAAAAAQAAAASFSSSGSEEDFTAAAVADPSLAPPPAQRPRT